MPDQPEDLPVLPAGFRFGTSTSAYQVEGGAEADGKGPSIWDTFTARPGAVLDHTSGARACDHYHRHHEDVALMQRLGTTGYRFSVAWPRVVPDGRGAVNEAGLDFYDRLVDDLLAAGQQPMVTLYHWDLPQALEDDGGWLNRETIEHFARYAEVVGQRLADRVEHWVPVNEPCVATLMGYGLGMHAPGRALTYDALPAGHHLLVAHGRAAIALRGCGRPGSPVSVGCANNHAPMVPASRHAADVGAAKLFDSLWNGAFLEPMLLGRYPADILPMLETTIADGDLATIRQPLDFYGLNYYNPMRIAATEDGSELPFEIVPMGDYATTDLGWPVVPDALRGWLMSTALRFRAALPPIFITENGCAYGTGPGPDGVVDDHERIAYLDAHLRAVRQAMDAGVDVRGYYAWSLLDNFEWAEGYSQRFGLVHVDFDSLVRTPKRSFDWYAATIAAQPGREHPAS